MGSMCRSSVESSLDGFGLRHLDGLLLNLPGDDSDRVARRQAQHVLRVGNRGAAGGLGALVGAANGSNSKEPLT